MARVTIGWATRVLASGWALPGALTRASSPCLTESFEWCGVCLSDRTALSGTLGSSDATLCCQRRHPRGLSATLALAAPNGAHLNTRRSWTSQRSGQAAGRRWLDGARLVVSGDGPEIVLWSASAGWTCRGSSRCPFTSGGL